MFPRKYFANVLGLIALALCLAWLPSATSGVFASPDETGVAVASEQIAHNGNAQYSEPLVRAIPWLHPRSWVSQGDALVPIGFLGWPALLSPLVRLGGAGILPWLGALVLLSSTYPVFLLFRRRFEERGAFLATILIFSFPTVLLYGNRGLFANVPQLALFAWWLLLVRGAREQGVLASRYRLFLVGLLGMVVLALRPFEGVWLLPWMYWFASPRTWTRTQRLAAVLGASIVLGLFMALTYKTYGSMFTIGYFLRDNPIPSLPVGMLPAALPVASVVPGGFLTKIRDVAERVLPYGFHPRHIWWNIRSFTTVFLWPWLLALALVWLPQIKEAKRLLAYRVIVMSGAVIGLSGWTVFVLLCVYGSGLYTDHITPGTVAIGNSFLRYVLPLLPLWTYAFLVGVTRLSARSRTRAVVGYVTLVLVGVGLHQAFLKDDEGLVATRRELIRYTQIRTEAKRLLPEGSVVLSDRSDKIFFPVFRAVTPIPPMSERARLAYDVRIPAIGLFARPLSQADRDEWRTVGLETQELASFGREQLYRLVPIRR